MVLCVCESKFGQKELMDVMRFELMWQVHRTCICTRLYDTSIGIRTQHSTIHTVYAIPLNQTGIGRWCFTNLLVCSYCIPEWLWCVLNEALSFDLFMVCPVRHLRPIQSSIYLNICGHPPISRPLLLRVLNCMCALATPPRNSL